MGEIQANFMEEKDWRLPVVCLIRDSKTINTIILPGFYANNQLVPETIGGENNKKLSSNGVEFVLECDQVCVKLFPLIAPMVVNMLEVGGNSNLWSFTLTGLHLNLLDLKSELIPVNITYNIINRFFIG